MFTIIAVIGCHDNHLDELPKDNFNQAHTTLINSSKHCDDLIDQFNKK